MRCQRQAGGGFIWLSAGQDSLHPLDAQLNFQLSATRCRRRRVALEAANSSFDEAGETLARYTGAHVPKRQLEELVQDGV